MSIEQIRAILGASNIPSMGDVARLTTFIRSHAAEVYARQHVNALASQAVQFLQALQGLGLLDAKICERITRMGKHLEAIHSDCVVHPQAHMAGADPVPCFNLETRMSVDSPFNWPLLDAIGFEAAQYAPMSATLIIRDIHWARMLRMDTLRVRMSSYDFWKNITGQVESLEEVCGRADYGPEVRVQLHNVRVETLVVAGEEVKP